MRPLGLWAFALSVCLQTLTAQTLGPTASRPIQISPSAPPPRESIYIPQSYNFRQSSSRDWAWERKDFVFQSIVLALQVADWRQTRQFERKGIEERNPLYGPRMTEHKADKIFATTAILSIGVAAALPNPYRRYFQMSSIAVSVGSIGQNLALGVSISF